MSIERKTVLVTGANRGIGAVIAKAFAQAGYNVAVGCRNEASVQNGGNAVAAACREYGVEADCFTGDVADFSACEQLVQQAIERFGTIDVLINNAGITRDGLLVKMSEEKFDDVIAANAKSVFNMTRHVAKGMMKRRSGCIINMSSVVGVGGNAGQFNYAASKAAIIGMTKTTARELGKRGITCNAIAPGFIETEMTGVLLEDVRAKMLEQISLGRYGKPEEVAQLAVFLASASYITGQTIIIDGGLMM